jgi:hypothetical protein
MKEPELPPAPPAKRPPRWLSGWFRVVLLAILVAGIGMAITREWFLWPLRHYRLFIETRDAIAGMADRLPDGVSPERWEDAVGWTLTAHGNCCSHHTFVDRAGFERFAGELSDRLADPVDLRTIDWIWDQYERLSPYGPAYSAQHHPTRPGRTDALQTWGLNVTAPVP